MNYEASDRYQNTKGAEYLAYQKNSAPRAVLETRKFSPHLRPTDRVLDFGCGGGWILRQLDCAERLWGLNESAHFFFCGNGLDVHGTLDEVEAAEFQFMDNEMIRRSPARAVRIMHTI